MRHLYVLLMQSLKTVDYCRYTFPLFGTNKRRDGIHACLDLEFGGDLTTPWAKPTCNTLDASFCCPYLSCEMTVSDECLQVSAAHTRTYLFIWLHVYVYRIIKECPCYQITRLSYLAHGKRDYRTRRSSFHDGFLPGKPAGHLNEKNSRKHLRSRTNFKNCISIKYDIASS